MKLLSNFNRALLACLLVSLGSGSFTDGPVKAASDRENPAAAAAELSPVYDVKVEIADIAGFWVLTPASRKSLGDLLDLLPPPKPDSGTIPMSSKDVGLRTCIIAFGSGYERAFDLRDRKGNTSEIMTGLTDNFPMGFGSGANTLITFSWNLNNPEPNPNSLFSPKSDPVTEAKQWLDMKYFPQPGTAAYQRYYFLKRGNHFRLQRHFAFSGVEKRIVLEWKKLDEPDS